MGSFNHLRLCAGVLTALAIGSTFAQSVHPPFQSTIWIDSALITPRDRSSYDSHVYAGTTEHWAYDIRQEDPWVLMNTYVFNVAWDEDMMCLGMVDTTYADRDSAWALVKLYAKSLGRLPRTLRQGVKGFIIMGGDTVWSCNSDSTINIHHEWGLERVIDGFMEEVFIHECSHASIDPLYETDSAWVKAVREDGRSVSDYANNTPSEDMAESFLPWLAERYLPQRISHEYIDLTNAAIPHRIAFFDRIPMDANPLNYDDGETPRGSTDTEVLMAPPVRKEIAVPRTIRPVHVCGGKIPPRPER